MNIYDHEKTPPRKFRPDLARTVTYGLPIFVSVHILGMFIAPLNWIWHFPPLLSFFSSLGLGFVIHLLVFTFGPQNEKDQG